MTPLACNECPTPELTPGDGWDCQDGIRTHCNHECMVTCRDCWDPPPADAYVCPPCKGHGTVLIGIDPDTGHPIDETCANCYGTGDLPC